MSRLQDESFGFGSDDSFDEHLSQIPIEEERQDMTDVSMSPVLKKRRTSIHSHKTKMKLSEIKFAPQWVYPVGKNGLERWPGMEGSPYQYDVLLWDEAQDMNPAMLDVCLKQVKPKLVVGDSQQQIYSFRGAVDALRIVKEHPATVVTRLNAVIFISLLL